MSLGTVLITVVLLLANAFFVGAEFAAMSARRSQLEPLAEEGSRGARAALDAMSRTGHPARDRPARHHRLLGPARRRLRVGAPPRARRPGRGARCARGGRRRPGPRPRPARRRVPARRRRRDDPQEPLDRDARAGGHRARARPRHGVQGRQAGHQRHGLGLQAARAGPRGRAARTSWPPRSPPRRSPRSSPSRTRRDSSRPSSTACSAPPSSSATRTPRDVGVPLDRLVTVGAGHHARRDRAARRPARLLPLPGRRRGRDALGLPAPQGRPLRRRGGAAPAGAGQADPPDGQRPPRRRGRVGAGDDAAHRLAPGPGRRRRRRGASASSSSRTSSRSSSARSPTPRTATAGRAAASEPGARPGARPSLVPRRRSHSVRAPVASAVGTTTKGLDGASRCPGPSSRVPPAGFEPAPPPPEGGALSPELRGPERVRIMGIRAILGLPRRVAA